VRKQRPVCFIELVVFVMFSSRRPFSLSLIRFISRPLFVCHSDSGTQPTYVVWNREDSDEAGLVFYVT
jgi:hypothetical protein